MKNSMLAFLLVFACSSTSSFAVTGQPLGESANVRMNCPVALESKNEKLKAEIERNGNGFVDLSEELYVKFQNNHELSIEELKSLGVLDEGQSLTEVIPPRQFITLRVPFVVPADAEATRELLEAEKKHWAQFPEMIFQVDARTVRSLYNKPEREYSDPYLKRIPLPEADPTTGHKFLNVQQKIAHYLLTNDQIPCVFLEGVSGSGKTTSFVYAANELKNLEPSKRSNRLNIEKIVITRSPTEMGKTLGFRPGTDDEKMAPLLDSFYDAAQFLDEKQEIYDRKNNVNRGNYRNQSQKSRQKNNNQKNGQKGKQNKPNQREQIDDEDEVKFGIGAHFTPLTYPLVRGRTLRYSMTGIDEAQNIPLDEFRTLITRTGEKSKVVFLGDVNQIDDNTLKLNPELTALAIGRRSFRNEWVCAHILLTESVRSELTAVAERALPKPKK